MKSRRFNTSGFFAGRSIRWTVPVLIILIGFLYLNLGHAISSGVSHADDAYMAIGSKNLAYGFGYGTTLTPDGSSGFVRFPAGYTTGPVLVFPVAAMVAIFGNHPWVPGVTTLMINVFLIFFLFYIIHKSNLTISLNGWMVVWILMMYNLTAGRFFEQWNAMLGEAPAALLTIMGVFLVSMSNNYRYRFLLAGFVFGLAFMAKMVSLLGFLPVIIWLSILMVRAGNQRKEHLKNLLQVLTTFLIPFLIFDLYKLADLGPEGYLNNYSEFFAAFSQWHDPVAGAESKGTGQFFSLLGKRFDSLGSTLGFSVAAFFLCLVIAGILIFRKSRYSAVPWSFGLLASGFLFHFIWWSVLSSGRIRYLFIGLLLGVTALTIIVFADLPMFFRILVIGLFFLVTLNCGENLLRPVAFVAKHQFRYTKQVKNMLKMADFLEKQEPGTTMVYVWWAEAADLAYSMKKPGNFIRIDHLSDKDFDHDIILVRNKKWEIPDLNHFFKSKITLFEGVLSESGHYKISRFTYPDSVLFHQIIKR